MTSQSQSRSLPVPDRQRHPISPCTPTSSISARSPDRRTHIVAELQRSGLDYEVVPAVDGRSLDLNDRNLVDPTLATRCPFPAGAAGCALSHFNVYKKIIDDGRDRALILEDDADVAGRSR